MLATPLVPIANIVVCERNKDETKLLIGCENGTLRGVARISLKGGLSIEKECTRMARSPLSPMLATTLTLVN